MRHEVNVVMGIAKPTSLPALLGLYSHVDADGSANDDDVFGDFAEDPAAEAVNSDLEAPWGV